MTEQTGSPGAQDYSWALDPEQVRRATLRDHPQAGGAVPAQQAVAPPPAPAAVPPQRPRFAVNTDVAPPPAVVAQPGTASVAPSVPAGMPAAPAGAPAAAAPQAAAQPAAAAPTRARAAAGRAIFGQQATDDDFQIDQLLRALVAEGGSDLHVTAGAPPMIRKNGSLVPLEGYPAAEPEGLRRALFSILKQQQRDRFDHELELDTSYAIPNVSRFRVNLFQQRESIGAVFRVIPFEIKPLEELGIPSVVSTFAGLPRGLVLVTGPTGSGKSTTLASIIDLANRSRADHIMTVEDPIEFLHQHKKSIVNQREVGEDTLSFANALKHVLRQDPDIILVGEMRDLETISVALTAAETGHLVFATLHTQDAAQSIDRIIDVFPPEQQGQIRTQLAATIQGIVCQTLCKRTGRPGRAVATEVLVATSGIRNLIREGKTHQIYSAMQAGRDQGMHTLDQHLADLVRTGQIAYETGLEAAHFVEDYNKLTGRQARMSQGGSTLQQAASQLGGV